MIWVHRYNRDNNNIIKELKMYHMYTKKKNLIQLLQTFFFLADLMKSGKALKGLQERSGKGKRNMKKVNAIEKVLSITLWLYV